MRRLLYILFFLSCLSLSLSAQSPRFVNYGPADGLASSSVYAITQDADGFLWVGTRGGLYRFDGIRFEAFNDGLPALRVTSLTVDGGGRLWIGTAAGLCVEGSTALSGRHVRALCTDRSGAVWAATKDSILVRMHCDGGAVMEDARLRYIIGDFEGDYPVQQIFPHPEGDLLLAGRMVPSQRVDESALQVSRFPESGGWNTGSYAWQGGRLWAYDDYISCLLRYDGATAAFVNVGCLPLAHAALFADSRDRLWAAGTYGLALVDTESPERSLVYRHVDKDPTTLSSNELYCIFEDRQGNIWVGGDNGLSVLCPAMQEVKTVSTAQVSALLQSRDGKLWIGTRDERISCLYEDSAGAVYVGYWNNTGFDIWKEGRKTHGKISGPVPVGQHVVASGDRSTSNWISDFLEGSDGRFWVVSWEGVGLNEWDRESGKTLPPEWLSPFKYPSPGRDSSIYLSSRLGTRLIEDPDGNLVYGTSEAGLSIINRETRLVTKYHTGNSSLPDNYVTDLCLTPDGTLWVATRAGLWSPSGEVLLNGKLVQSVEADDRGRLWAGTEEGLYFVDTDGSIGVARKGLGFPSDIYGEHVSCRLADGSLAFGGPSGAVVFHPDSLLSVCIERMLPLTSLYRHRYRINGGEWINERFTGLPGNLMPGSYVVEKQRSDVFGRWEHGTVSVETVRIPVPLLLRWPLLLLYVLLLAGAIWLYIRRRERLARRAMAENLYYSIISHDLKGPVSGIRHLSDALSDRLDSLSPEEVRHALEEIKSAASGTSHLLENLLLWSLGRKQDLRPDLRPERLEDIVEEVLGSLDKRGVAIKTSVEADVTVLTDRNMLTTCLRNLLENAIRYSPDGGTVSLSVTRSAIVVRDEGPGMEEKVLASLMKPGHLGLVITRELLNKLGGCLRGRNLPEGGCEMTMELPWK